MATITLIIVIIWWNPQKLINYYIEETKQELADREKNKVENVN